MKKIVIFMLIFISNLVYGQNLFMPWIKKAMINDFGVSGEVISQEIASVGSFGGKFDRDTVTKCLIKSFADLYFNDTTDIFFKIEDRIYEIKTKKMPKDQKKTWQKIDESWYFLSEEFQVEITSLKKQTVLILKKEYLTEEDEKTLLQNLQKTKEMYRLFELYYYYLLQFSEKEIATL